MIQRFFILWCVISCVIILTVPNVLAVGVTAKDIEAAGALKAEDALLVQGSDVEQEDVGHSLKDDAEVSQVQRVLQATSEALKEAESKEIETLESTNVNALNEEGATIEEENVSAFGATIKKKKIVDDVRSTIMEAKKLEDVPLEERNYPRIVELYKLAAQQGSSEGAFALARLYKRGYVKAPSEKSVQDLVDFAIANLKNKIEKGNGRAAVELAFAYMDGQVLDRSEEQYYYWLKKGAELKSPSAQLALGKVAIWGILPDYSRQKAIEMIQQAADSGMVSAWLELGRNFAGAYGGTVDHPRSFYAFLQAAQGGNTEALRQVGMAYLGGFGVKKNTEQAVRYIQQAVDNGNTEAMLDLALMYYYGQGVEKNFSKSIDLFKKADGADIPEASYYLGMIYLNGQGIGADKNKAITYLRRAASTKLSIARYQLKTMGVKE